MNRGSRQLQQLRMVAKICDVQRASAEQNHLLCTVAAQQAEGSRDHAQAQLSSSVAAWKAASAQMLLDPGTIRLWGVAVQDNRGAVADAERQLEGAVAVQAGAADRARAATLRCRVVDDVVERAGKLVARQAEEAALARSTDQRASRRREP